MERVVQNQPGGLAAGPLAPVVIVRNEDGEPRVAVDLVYLAQGDVADVLVGGVPTDGKDDFAVVTAERLETLLLLLWLDRALQADRIHDLGAIDLLVRPLQVRLHQGAQVYLVADEHHGFSLASSSRTIARCALRISEYDSRLSTSNSACPNLWDP